MAGITVLSGSGAQDIDFTTWEDKAYRVTALVFFFLGLAMLTLFSGLTPLNSKADSFAMVAAGIQTVMALLLFFEVEWAQFIAKWFLALSLVRCAFAYLLIFALLSTSPTFLFGLILGIVNTIMGAITGFMLYLLLKVADV
jgi:hypothetical protein